MNASSFLALASIDTAILGWCALCLIIGGLAGVLGTCIFVLRLDSPGHKRARLGDLGPPEPPAGQSN